MLRKNQAFRTSLSLILLVATLLRWTASRVLQSLPCLSQPAAVQSMIVPSFLTLHTIVDCIVSAETRDTNCLHTSVRTSQQSQIVFLHSPRHFAPAVNRFAGTSLKLHDARNISFQAVQLGLQKAICCNANSLTGKFLKNLFRQQIFNTKFFKSA